jgi:hypothetical protein
MRITEEKRTADGKYIRTHWGNSSVVKPKEDLADGSVFIEVDTGATYFFDEAADDWVQVSTSGSGDASKENAIAEFSVSDTIKATLYEDGTLAITGHGDMPTYTSQSLPPWVSVETLSQVKRLIVSDSVNVDSVAYWFYEPNNAGMLTEIDKINVPKSVTKLPYTFLTAIDVHHVNLARHKTSGKKLTTFNCIGWYQYTHCVYSIPKEICDADFISLVTASIAGEFASLNNNVALVITDSEELKNAIFTAQAGKSWSATTNIGCIYCSELGADGFPTYWSGAMKRVFPEIIKYVGLDKQTDTTASASNTMTSLSHYARAGTPHVYANESVNTSIMGVTANGFERQAQLELNANYAGSPYDTSLDALANGVSCNGFVCWLYWRYFKENFLLPSTSQFISGTNVIGKTIPVTTVSASNLKPFDILCYHTTLPDADGGHGHIAIYLSTDADGNYRVIHSTSGSGLTFGTWTLPVEAHTEKLLRLNKTGISKGLLRQS